MIGLVSSPAEEPVVKRPWASEFADAVQGSIDCHPNRAFAVLTVFYVATCVCMSHQKLLWLDELITLHIARLGSVAEIWAALSAGADPNPPVTHVLVHVSRLIFGEGAFALRLPAVAGYWLGMVSLFAYLRQRLPGTWALVGTVLSMTMAAFDYSFESRSYGIFYGFSMAAFYCWTLAATSVKRKTRVVSGIGMCLALTAGLSTHYFAVLAFLPVAAGEIAQTLIRYRRTGESRGLEQLWASLNVWMWVAFLVAATPLLAYRSMIAHSIAEFAPYAWNKVSIGQAMASYTEMVETMLYPLLGLFAFYGAIRLLSTIRVSGRDQLRPQMLQEITTALRTRRAVLPVHETVGVFILMVFPLLGYIVASIRGGMMSPRFVIPVCFGFAVAGTVLAYRLFGHLPRAGVALLCFFLAWFIARESFVGYCYAEQKRSFYNVLDRVAAADAYLPNQSAIAVPDPLMALTMQHYAPPAIASRIVFPLDFPAIRRFRRGDSAEQNIWAGRSSIYTLRVLPLATFQEESDQYLILASESNWMLQDLDRHHYAEHRLPIDTRADAIGGFTPLMHGLPAFYIGSGALSPAGPLAPGDLPVPFKVSANLPNARDIE